MMDTIKLYGIDVFGHHGVHPAERELGQRFVIDVDLWHDCTAAALSDDLARAVDYTGVHRIVCEVAAAASYQLIEALAGQICRALLIELAVEKVGVCVHKPHPPMPNFLGQASVTLVRDRAWLQTGFETAG